MLDPMLEQAFARLGQRIAFLTESWYESWEIWVIIIPALNKAAHETNNKPLCPQKAGS
jgi:hypothetical protein